MLIVPPTSRRCTLNRTYRERNSAVWCGTVQCTFSCSLLGVYPRIPCFIMTNEIIILCQKHQRLVYGVYPRTPIYPQYTPVKNLGGLGNIWGGLCPPGPSLKPPLSYSHNAQRHRVIDRPTDGERDDSRPIMPTPNHRHTSCSTIG